MADSANSVAGANVTGVVANATHADTADNATTATNATNATNVPWSGVSGKPEIPPMWTYGTADLTAGSSALETGKLYFMYE